MTTSTLPTTSARGGPQARTLRKDRWWIEPLVYFVVLGSFIVYATWAVFVGKDFLVTEGGRHYISPFYSPCVANACGDGTTPALGKAFGSFFLLSRIIILLGPLGFRATCYYYRKAYYRSFWLSPPACAVSEPHGKYSGERRFPLILQNSHRYWWYIAMLFNILLAYDAIKAFDFGGSFGMGIGSLVLLVNVFLILAYTLSCHSCRHILGGRLNHFSRHPIRYKAWTMISKLNAKHGVFAMTSLVFIALTDLYIRLVSAGWIHDVRFF
jgi:hypothetical protein